MGEGAVTTAEELTVLLEGRGFRGRRSWPSVEPSLPSLRSLVCRKQCRWWGNLIARTSFPQLETVLLARLLFFFQASCRLRFGPGNRIGLSVRSQPNPAVAGEGEALSSPAHCAVLRVCRCGEWQWSLANEDAGRAGA